MIDLAAYAQKFFIFGGFLLIVIAVVQLLTRPREKGARRPTFRLDATTIRTMMYFTAGVLAVLIGFGVIPMAGPR